MKIISVMRELTRKKGIKLVELTAASSGEVAQTTQGLVARDVQAIYIPSDNTAYQALDGILKVAATAHLPVINDDAEYLSHGMLASVGPGFFQSGKATAPYVARVLLGENPANIPMTNVSVNVTALNPDVAKKLGITLSPALLREIESSSKPTVSETGARRPLQKKWKVHVIELNDVPAIEESQRGVMAGLAESGLVTGQDFEAKVLNAQGDLPTLSSMVDSALGDQTDMLIVISTVALQAAIKKVQTIPIVFAQVTDPIKAGAGRSLTDHLPNVTGSTPLSDHNQMIKVIRTCLPSVKRIGTLFNPSEDNSVIQKDGLIAAAKKEGIEVEAVGINQSGDMPNAASALSGRGIDAICQISDNLTSAGFPSIVKVARQAKLPLFCYQTPQAKDGALVAVARDFLDAGKVAGKLAARVMRGEKPGDLPFELVSRTGLVLNQQEAQTIGRPLPESLVREADGIIDAAGYHSIQKK